MSTLRIAVGLLTCLGAGAVTAALADPTTETAAAATIAAPCPEAKAAAAQTQAATPQADAAPGPDAAAAKAAAAQAELDNDTKHFLAEGYKPEMRGGEQVYCKKETALGSRLAPVKNCGTIEQLRLAEQKTKSGVFDAQRQQIGTSFH